MEAKITVAEAEEELTKVIETYNNAWNKSGEPWMDTVKMDDPSPGIARVDAVDDDVASSCCVGSVVDGSSAADAAGVREGDIVPDDQVSIGSGFVLLQQ